MLFINLEEEVWRREELSIRSREEDLREAEENIPKEYADFNDRVFNKAVFEKLPDRSKWDHTIELTPNAILKDCKVYPLNIKEQEELNKFLEEYLKSGRIRLSKLLGGLDTQRWLNPKLGDCPGSKVIFE